MTPLITHPIAPAGFELVRDQIGAILALEINNQQELTPDNFKEDFGIFVERLTPAQSEEEVIINVHVASGLYPSMTQQSGQGRTVFFVDIDTAGTETIDKTVDPPVVIPGSLVSAQALHKYMRLVMYIFRSPFYRMLGFQPGLIGGTYVEQFNTLDPNRKEDSDFTTFARILISVSINENTETWQGVPLLGNNTSVKLDLTEKGYKFVFNN